MRSSKQRSRTKQNRHRPLGNVVNRVFDSSGPEGKVRGTPQQIIDKYLLLARDAQLSNDRVAAENFLQHAEHYTRMLAEAQREAQAEADARRQQHEQQQQRDQQQRDQQQQREQQQRDHQQRERTRAAEADPRPEPQPASSEVLGDPSGGSDDQSILVETPESRGTSQHAASDAEAQPEAPKPRNTRKPRASAAKKAEPAAEQPAEEASGEDAPAPRKRAVRKPRATTRKAADKETAETGGNDTPKSATG